MAITTTRTTSTGSKSNGQSHRHVQTSVNGHLKNSYDSTRSTTMSAGNKHVNTVRSYSSAPKPMKSIPMPKMAKPKSSPAPKAPRASHTQTYKVSKTPRVSSTGRTSRSSTRNGSGIDGVILLGLITGIWFLLMAVFKGFRALFTKKAGPTQSSSGLMSTQEVPSIEAKQ